MKGLETRVVPVALRAAEPEDSQVLLSADAAVFNQRSEDLGGFIETIEPGFFRNVLNGDTVALFQHDEAFVLGRTTATPPTLSLEETPTVLRSLITVADNARNREWVIDPIGRGEIRHMSFAFRVGPDGDQWGELEDGRLLRTLKAGGCSSLGDVSPVTRPAYPGTDVSAAKRSLDRWLGTQRSTHGADDIPLSLLRLRARLVQTQLSCRE